LSEGVESIMGGGYRGLREDRGK